MGSSESGRAAAQRHGALGGAGCRRLRQCRRLRRAVAVGPPAAATLPAIIRAQPGHGSRRFCRSLPKNK